MLLLNDSLWKSETRKPQLNTGWGRTPAVGWGLEGCREVGVGWRSENGGVPWASMDMEVAARGLRPRDSVPHLWGRRHKIQGAKRAGMPGWQ